MTLDTEDLAAIEDIIRRLITGCAPAPAILTAGAQAIQLARQGKIEESKALLKAHSKLDSIQRREAKKRTKAA